MTPHLVYYLFFIVGVIAYREILKYYRPLEMRTKKIKYIRRILIISLYLIAGRGLYLTSKLEGDTLFNMFFLISSAAILFICLYMIRKLEILRN